MKNLISKIKELVKGKKEWFILRDNLKVKSNPSDELSWRGPFYYKESLRLLMSFPDAVLIHRKKDSKVMYKKSVINRDRYEKVL